MSELHYRKKHNHRWAENLSAAKKAFESGNFEVFYRGDLQASFQYPGMKIMGAFWVAENMEMKERLSIHLDVLPVNDEGEYEKLSVKYYEWFIEDFKKLAKSNSLFGDEDIASLVDLAAKNELSDFDWESKITSLQAESESGEIKPELLKEWFFFCGRFILSYARNLIRQGVRTALYVQQNGKEALEKAIAPTIEYFSWKINRVFFNEAMPRTGFSDLGDIVGLGAYGMLSDQEVGQGSEIINGEVTEKRSILKTCQLYGFIDSVATFMGLEKGATSGAYCPFCVGHGRTTMHFVVPPDRTVKYSLETGLGYHGDKCTFLLETIPGEDDARCDEATAKIFGDEPLSY